MNVLHVIDTLGRGGAEQVLVMLLPELARQGVGVGVVVRGGAMDLAPQLETAGVAVLRLRKRHRWNLIGLSREIAAIARDRKADIVHAHLYFPAVGTSLMRVLRLSPARTCVTFHNLAYAGATRAGLGLTLRRWLAAGLHRRGMDKCLAVSEAVAAHDRAALGLRQVDVLPNPVDLRVLRPMQASLHRSTATGAACTLVLPGRIVREKGHADLLDALALMARTGPLPELVIAGDGPLRAEVEARVDSLGLRDRVRFAGALDHGLMLDVMARADIVVVPSRHEGFGLTALEAMALGRAVIASSAGGLPETLGDTGMLVPVRDLAALAHAVVTLCADPERRHNLGLAAARRAGLFDLPEIARRQIDCYRSLMVGGT